MRSPSPRVWVRVHGALVLVWMLMTIPAVLFWKDSVPFLVAVSIYANVAGSAASWQAARADCNSPTREDLKRLDHKISALMQRR